MMRDSPMTQTAFSFLKQIHPYDALPAGAFEALSKDALYLSYPAGAAIYGRGDALDGLYVIESGEVAVFDENDNQLSLLQAGNSFGERGLMKDGLAVTSARAQQDCRLICIPPELFHKLRADHAVYRRFFDRTRATNGQDGLNRFDLTRVQVASLMVTNPVTCPPSMTIQDAAQKMRDEHISCLCVVDRKRLTGIVTTRDLAGKALAQGLAHDTPISAIMTGAPRVLAPTAIGSDVLHMMMEYRLGHLPIVEGGQLVGIVTQTDLTRFQASNTAGFVAEAARTKSIAELAAVTRRIPNLLVQLVSAGNRHDVVTRMITDIADVVTRRLLSMAEDKYGPPPARYAWLAIDTIRNGPPKTELEIVLQAEAAAEEAKS